MSGIVGTAKSAVNKRFPEVNTSRYYMYDSEIHTGNWALSFGSRFNEFGSSTVALIDKRNCKVVSVYHEQ